MDFGPIVLALALGALGVTSGLVMLQLLSWLCICGRTSSQ
jgi:hypothetical protein